MTGLTRSALEASRRQGQENQGQVFGNRPFAEHENRSRAGEHTQGSLILDLALALAEDRRRDIARKTRNGLESAARHGRKGGCPHVVDDDKRRAILARRAERDVAIRDEGDGAEELQRPPASTRSRSAPWPA
jgi:hypothetical protein